MLTTVMFSEVTLRRSDGNSTMHVPLPPRSPVVQVLEFVPSWLQCPTTVAPFSRLWFSSCTVISTVADHLFPLVDVMASRSPMCMVFGPAGGNRRSEEHTSELQSQSNLVCRLLLEKKKKR